MKEQVKMGMNRTGAQMSPIDSGEMKDATSMMLASGTVAEQPDTVAMARIRSDYIGSSDQLGSVPVPLTATGALSTAVGMVSAMVSGIAPQLLVDKLGERLAFERTGTRIYDAMITKVAALEQGDVAALPLDQLIRMRDQEAEHVALVADAIQRLGADPTAQTPCADLAGVESCGLIAAVVDPRTTVTQSLHAILIAEMADNSGWEMLIALAENQHHDEMARRFTVALEHERDHLQLVRSWFEELTLGAPMPAGPLTSGTAPLH
jgi:rubrerythrin